MSKTPHFKVCHCCGFPVVSEEMGWLFRGQQQLIFDIVSASGSAGIAGEELVARVYRDDPDGGPLYARNVIAVQIRQQINPRLEPLGLRITAGRGRDAQPYRLVPLMRARRARRWNGTI
jgi:hypothetical protein